MESDTELLQQFIRSGDEAAFGQLVARHAPMMRGVALRTTGDAALADEVTQTVFAILARKARGLRHEALAGWLHRTTFLEARNASRKASRYRRALEQFQEESMTPIESGSAAPEEILPHLDLALTKLKPPERQMVVLRFFERQSVRDIASATGSTEEACRKRLQRSIDRLGAVLRRRGLVTSSAGLAAVLAGQSFCAAPASAATLASAALKSSTALTQTSLFSHSLLLVNTATAIKTSVAAVILAAIPVAWLWNQNSDLREQVAALRMAGSPAVTTSPRAGESKLSPLSSAPGNTKTAAGKSRQPDKSTANPVTGAPLLSREALAEMMRSDAEMQTLAAFNRLCASLPDLTGDQQAQLRAVLEAKAGERMALLDKLLTSGGVEKFLNPENLSEEDKAHLATLSELDSGVADSTLKEILTPEQYDRHESLQESRRQTAAENAANDTLRQMDAYVDLTPEQKDALFQKIADSQLASPGEPAVATANAILDAAPDAREALIRSVLTPQQVQAYDDARAREKQAMEKLMKFVPNLLSPGDSGTK